MSTYGAEDTPLVSPRRFTTQCCSFRNIAIIILSIITVILLVVDAILIAKAVENCKPTCRPVQDSSTNYSRSASLSLLKNITDVQFTCSKTEINARLIDEGVVTIYQTDCKNLNTRTFQIDRRSLLYENVSMPIVVLSEDFTDNYFVGGELEVRVNATFNSGSDMYVCFFSDVQVFFDFTNSDKDWKRYVDMATCRSTTEEDFSTTFDIGSPSYVFIAIASTGVLTTLQFGYSGSVHNFKQSSDDMSQVCSLKSDKPSESECSFTINDAAKDNCILASSEGNVDGSYDYSAITLTTVTYHAEEHVCTSAGVALAAITAVVSTIILSLVTVILIIVAYCKCSKSRLYH